MKKYLLGMFGLVFAIGMLSTIFSTHVTNPSEGGLKYNSKVCIEKNGELVQCGPNTLTNAGKNIIRDFLTAAGATTTSVSNIALCNSSNHTGNGGLGNGCVQPAVGNTYLEGEYFACGLSRAAGTLTVQDVAAGNFSYAKTFTATCDSLETNVTSIYNGTAAATQAYFAGNNFTSVTLQTDDQLTVTWYVWVT